MPGPQNWLEQTSLDDAVCGVCAVGSAFCLDAVRFSQGRSRRTPWEESEVKAPQESEC